MIEYGDMHGWERSMTVLRKLSIKSLPEPTGLLCVQGKALCMGMRVCRRVGMGVFDSRGK